MMIAFFKSLLRMQPREDTEPDTTLQTNQQENESSDTAQAVKNSPSYTWQDKRLRNQKESALYRMPNELLHIIFEEADFLSQQMLRQTCSKFAALITDLTPNRADKPFDGTFDIRQVWPCHGSQTDRDAIRAPWAALVRRDITDLCKQCTDFDKSGELDRRLKWLRQPLYCTGCYEMHERGMFPRKNRGFWGVSRLCIGWQGSMRVCPHLSISKWACELEIRRLKYEGWQGANRPVFVCLEGCHWEGCSNIYDVSKIPPFKNQQTHITKEPANEWDYSPPFTMAVMWANCPWDIDASRPVSRHQLRSFYETLDTGTGPYFCPHMSVKDGQLFRALQAPFCRCFPDDNDECAYAVQEHVHTTRCEMRCHCAQEARASSGQQSDFWTWRHAAYQHMAICSVCKAEACWKRQGNRIYLQYCSLILDTSASRSSWIRKLDPHSWDITKDEQTKHVYWCPDKDCRTNYRWYALYRRLRI